LFESGVEAEYAAKRRWPASSHAIDVVFVVIGIEALLVLVFW
jgi:hypothetical protein